MYTRKTLMEGLQLIGTISHVLIVFYYSCVSRAAKRSDINMLKLILKPDMTYFKDVKVCELHVHVHVLTLRLLCTVHTCINIHVHVHAYMYMYVYVFLLQFFPFSLLSHPPSLSHPLSLSLPLSPSLPPSLSLSLPPSLSPSLPLSLSPQGCTVMHVSAHEGCEAGIEYIMSLRPESVHDTDKMVT